MNMISVVYCSLWYITVTVTMCLFASSPHRIRAEQTDSPLIARSR